MCSRFTPPIPGRPWPLSRTGVYCNCGELSGELGGGSRRTSTRRPCPNRFANPVTCLPCRRCPEAASPTSTAASTAAPASRTSTRRSCPCRWPARARPRAPLPARTLLATLQGRPLPVRARPRALLNTGALPGTLSGTLSGILQALPPRTRLVVGPAAAALSTQTPLPEQGFPCGVQLVPARLMRHMEIQARPGGYQGGARQDRLMTL